MASARRSLGAALQMTPEKLAFIKSTPEPAPITEPTIEVASSVVQQERPATMEVQSPVAEVQEKPVTRSPRRRERIEEEEISDEALLGMNNLLVPLTTRLQPRTAAALKRAGLEQKLRGRKPSSVQEIVEIAIQTWLRSAKFLD